MLTFEISMGVFLGLLLFWLFYNSKVKRAADLENIKQMALNKKMALEEYIKEIELFRAIQFSNYLEVFKDRLLTLEDDETITFQDAGIIELQLFFEHSDKLIDKIKAEEHTKLERNSFDMNLRSEYEFAINQYFNSALNTMQSYALKLFEEKLLEIANSKVKA